MRAITIAHLPSALLFHVCSPGTAVCTACREPGRCVASLLLSQTHMRTYKDTIIFLECSFSHSLTCPETSSTSVWPVRMYLKSRQESGHSSPSGVRGKDPGNLAMVEPQLLSHPRLPPLLPDPQCPCATAGPLLKGSWHEWLWLAHALAHCRQSALTLSAAAPVSGSVSSSAVMRLDWVPSGAWHWGGASGQKRTSPED